MIQPYRRHNADCTLPFGNNRCKCPVWATGTLPNGKRIRKSLKTRDWLTAQTKIRNLEVVGEQPQTGMHTMVEFRERFLQSIVKRNLAPETQRKYRFILRQLEAFAQDKGLRFVNEFDPDLIEQFRNTWNDQPLSASRKIEQLKTMFKFALKLRWIEENPAADLEKPKVEEDTTGEPFSQDEMTRIIRAAKEDPDSRILPFILVMRFSGLRISDTAMLRLDSVQGSHLSVRMRKTGGEVKILLEEWMIDLLRSVPHEHPEYFFWSGNSKLTTLTNLWRKRLARVFNRAKVPNSHPHRYRDTFAVELLIAGVSLEDVSHLLGHKSIKITEKHYCRWVQARQDKADEAVRKANGSHGFERLIRGLEAQVIPLRKKA